MVECSFSLRVEFWGQSGAIAVMAQEDFYLTREPGIKGDEW